MDLSASTGHNTCRLRIWANQRQRDQPFGLEWKHIVFVFEQDDAFRRRFTSHNLMLRAINGSLWLFVGKLESASPCDQEQQTTYALINGRLVYLTTLDSMQELLTPPGGRARHLQIQSRFDRGHSTLGSKPVGHHNAIKVPFFLKNFS